MHVALQQGRRVRGRTKQSWAFVAPHAGHIRLQRLRAQWLHFVGIKRLQGDTPCSCSLASAAAMVVQWQCRSSNVNGQRLWSQTSRHRDQRCVEEGAVMAAATVQPVQEEASHVAMVPR
jgi:hypothetical protein